MTYVQQLLQQIEQALQSPVLEKNGMLEELAAQMADVCDQANARLQRCMDYLDKGMRSEAVNESKNVPDLLQLGTLFENTVLDKWHNLCSDLEMTPFTPLNANALKRLKAAVVIEYKMEPLLREYRRMVYQGNHRGCIDMLRKIRAFDKDNPSWEANLAPLESAELPALQEQAEQALAAKDRKTLAPLYSKLAHPQRAVPASPALLKRMRRELLDDKAEQLKAKGEKLMQQAMNVLLSPTVEQVDELLQKMASLEKQVAFLHKPQCWDETIVQLKQCLEMAKARSQQKAIQMEKVHAFQELLASGKADEAQIRKEWELLTEQGAPVSAMLENQVRELLDSRRRHHKRMRWGVVVAVSLVIVVGALAASYITYVRYKNEALCQVVERMKEMKEAGRYREFLNYCTMIEKQNPDWAVDSSIQTMKQEVQEIVSRLDNSARGFASSMQELDRIGESGYAASDEKIQKLLDDSSRMARQLNDAEKEGRVTEWKNGWQQWKIRRQNAADDELKRRISLVDTVLAEQQKKPYDTLQEVLDKVAELQAELRTAQDDVPLASYAVRTRFSQAEEKLKTWERTAREKERLQKQTEGKLAEARQAVLAGFSNFNQYRSALQRYVSVAPKGEQMRQECQYVLKVYDVYEEAASLGVLELKMPPTVEENAKMKEALSKTKVANSLWSSSLKQAQKYFEHEQALADLTKLIIANKELVDMYYLQYREKGSSQWKRLYCTENMLQHRALPDMATPQTKYWGMVYQWHEGEKQPVLVHTKDIFKDNDLTTLNYDFRIKGNVEENRSEFGRFVTRFVANAPGYPQTFGYLLKGILTMFDDTSVEPVLQAVFVQQVLTLLDEQYGEVIPEVDRLHKEFTAIDTQVPWGNPQLPAVQKCVEQYRKAVEKNRGSVVEMESRLKQMRALTEYILETGVAPVGTLQRDGSGKLVLKLTGTYHGEVWGIRRVAASTRTEFYVISNNGKDLREDATVCCTPWMPVFAPQKDHGVLNAKLDKSEMERPAAWPVNAW